MDISIDYCAGVHVCVGVCVCDISSNKRAERRESVQTRESKEKKSI